MDIHVSGLPENATEKQVRAYFERIFSLYGIKAYHCTKHNSKTFANITVLDQLAANRFLTRYGVAPNAGRGARPQESLRWHDRFLRCTRSHHPVDEFALKSIVFEASEKTRKAIVASSLPPKPKKEARDPTRFGICSLHCGVWDYTFNELVFVPHYLKTSMGALCFGSNAAAIVFNDIRIDIHYPACSSIVLGGYEDPAITFTLINAPKFFRTSTGEGDDVVAALAALAIAQNAPGRRQPRANKSRMTGIDGKHSQVAGTCLVYRLKMTNYVEIGDVSSLLLRNIKAPPRYVKSTQLVAPSEPMTSAFVRLRFELGDEHRFGHQPFSLRYQLERLAHNVVLLPRTVIALLPKTAHTHELYGLDATLSALGKMVRQVPIAGPEVEAEDLSLPAIEALLEKLAKEYVAYRQQPGNPYELVKRHTHINLVHRIVVTPCGVYLEGPEPEPTNRVLRRYSGNVDHFSRVLFQDEDGSAVRYDPLSSQDIIYHKRFKDVLDNGIMIADRLFCFLGFSHSSLRSQSCWFMASFWTAGRLNDPTLVLKDLGDFSHIRIPAKCAARIGQNFTDTNATIDLRTENVEKLDMVQRNGYDFGDGVGTISWNLLERVWSVYGKRRVLQPTAVQIRYKGYKGMVALDSRLGDQRLMLRDNMKKYDASATVCNLEICGAGFRPLPMVLNRQFIKIFEDLGIAPHVFMDLQKIEIDRLRDVTTKLSSTVRFLHGSECVRASQLPSLVEYLHRIGLDWCEDSFLPGVVDIAVMSKLQDIKYRGRIPIERGHTLYGIMDETGELKENEVFVVTEHSPNTGRQVLVRNNVVVTRSPALHPGDVQVVNAVNVRHDSPLLRLSNVVVFSQHGARDLPSKLSGGDLDGDLYNIIYDQRLVPQVTHEPAEYPRVIAEALDRNVTSKDMSDFFVTFMQTDLLGQICNIHTQLADQSNLGTLDPRCMQLAAMASTAVDFSKTGIPVDMRQCPKYNSCRPDFMSPSPRIIPVAQGTFDLEAEEDDDDDDAFEDLDVGRRKMRYYESNKVLGHLFRAIDERQFLANLHKDRCRPKPPGGVMSTLLASMKAQASRYGILYSHHRDLALDIRTSYEDNLLDLLYMFEPSPKWPVSEQEAFAGTILGRVSGLQGKPLREQGRTMRERFNSVVEYTIMRIVKGDEQLYGTTDLDLLYNEEDLDREVEALPRAIACLEIAIEEKGMPDYRLGELQSFKYVVAGVCLREMERFGTSMGM